MGLVAKIFIRLLLTRCLMMVSAVVVVSADNVQEIAEGRFFFSSAMVEIFSKPLCKNLFEGRKKLKV